MTPVKGFQFYHARILDSDNCPMLYVVTKIARDTVYYRPVAGGAPNCCPTEQFCRWVKEAA